MVREIEAEPLGLHQRALLPHVGAQPLAEDVMHQVRGAVVPLDVAAARRVHRRMQRFRLERIGEITADDRSLLVLPHRVDGERPSLAPHPADVAHLPARLGVERVLPQQQLDPRTLLSEREHVGVGLGGLVADELLLSALHRPPLARPGDVDGGTGALAAARRAGAAPLLLQRALEAGEVHVHAPLAGDDLGQVDGKPEGVVQLERVVAGNDPCARGEDLLQPPEPTLDGLEEPVLLGLRHLTDERGLGDQLRIELAHLLDDDIGERRQCGLPAAQEPGVPHRAPQYAAQHVPAPFVARVDAVGQEEAHRAGVVGQHPVGGAVLGVAVVRFADQAAHPLDQRQEEVSVEIVVLALHDRRDPLEPRAGVHGRLRERRQGAVGGAIVLHEDQVPDLEEATFLGQALELFLRHLPGRDIASTLGPRQVHVDLGAGPAGPGVAHLPEIVLVTQAVDLVIGQSGDLTPVLPGLVVGVVHGDPETLRRDTQVGGAGDELPGEGDRVALEVVAEGEVAQHLEEGVVPPGVPHLLEVVVLAAGAHALLAGGRAHIVPPLLAEEGALELHHARVGEQQRGIVGRDQ
jgi:hypothetical protein